MDTNIRYDRTNKESVINYAKALKGLTLRRACDLEGSEIRYTNKGSFGQFLEKLYFKYLPNSDSRPDFYEIGYELKSSPLKKMKNGEFRSKERLVLNVIDFNKIVKEEFESSGFINKNAHLILVFYLHEYGVDVFDYLIKLVDEWTFPKEDLEIIKKDWEYIQQKVQRGEANELSEGDTYYLGACTKGANSSSVRTQPNSDQMAKQRAFSLKQGYVNHIIATIANEPNEVYGRLLQNISSHKEVDIEKYVVSRFENYYGLSIGAILARLGVALNKDSKSFYADLTNLILGVELGKKIEEFEKADLTIRTVRVNSKGMPKEDVSFPVFSYLDVINEEWDVSQTRMHFEHKFLFVFLKEEDNGLILEKVKFWNMSVLHLAEVERVWKRLRDVLLSGNIVSKVIGGRRSTNFPNTSFSEVAHIRPHAKNASDTIPLPVPDKETGAVQYTKHSFWLNKRYVRDEIYLK